MSLSWVGFLAQAGGLIGACLGFSFISLVEVVYWFIIRFFRLSKIEKAKAKLETTHGHHDTDSVGFDKIRSFEKLWCEGWESPCVDTAVSTPCCYHYWTHCIFRNVRRLMLRMDSIMVTMTRQVSRPSLPSTVSKASSLLSLSGSDID